MKTEKKQQIYEILRNELEENKESINTKIKLDDIVNEILDLILEKERKQASILKYIDLSNISFDNQNVEGIDFTGTNANINPQTVQNKSLQKAKLSGLDFKDKSFDDVLIVGTDFTKATNVNLDPQKIKSKTMVDAILSGIDFQGKSFDDVCVWGVNFTGAINVNLEPQTVRYKSLYQCILSGIDFKNKSFKGVNIRKANFINTKNVNINRLELKSEEKKGAIFEKEITQIVPTEQEKSIESYQEEISRCIKKCVKKQSNSA